MLEVFGGDLFQEQQLALGAADRRDAGALVTEGKVFPDGSLIVGSPAVVKRELTPEQIEGLAQSAKHYVNNAQRLFRGLRRIT